jgi:outer membrane protein assembly factor BamB
MWKRRVIATRLAVAVLAAALVPAASATADSWPQFGRGARQSRVNPHEDVLSYGTLPGVRVAWDAQFKGVALTPPVVHKGSVYLGGTNRAGTQVVLWRFAEDTGSKLWAMRPGCSSLEGEVPALAVGKGTLVVALRGCSGPTSSVGLFDAETGEGRLIDFPDSGMSAPTIHRGSVYVFTAEENTSQFTKLDLRTGEIIWSDGTRDEYDTGNSTIISVTHGMLTTSPDYAATFSPIISKGIVYAGSDLDFWDPQTGTAITPPKAYAAPCAREYLCAFDAETFDTLWQRVAGPPVVYRGSVYAACDANNFCVLDGRTGGVHWIHAQVPEDTFFRLESPAHRPIIAGNAVYVGVHNYAADTDEIFAYRASPTPGGIRVATIISPAGEHFVVVNGTIYTSGADIGLRAYRP